MSWVAVLGFALTRPGRFSGMAGPDFSPVGRAGPGLILGLAPNGFLIQKCTLGV